MGRPDSTATNSAHTDANQNFSIIGVIGTLGTTDARGTALTLPVAIDPSTGAMYVNNLGASGTGGGGTTVQVAGGTIGSILGIGGTLQTSGPASTISTNNSTTGTLGIGGIYTGTFEDVTSYSEMRVSVFASHPSATDGLVFQQSPDGTNVDVTDTYTIPATTGKTFVVPRQAKFFNVKYTNGGTAQTSFRLQTILNRTATSASSQRSSDLYTNETDLEQMWSFNSIWNGTAWDRIKGTSGTIFTAMQAGTVNVATVTLNSGTINVGTFVNNGGTVAVVQNAGTLAGGTLGNLVSGTINSATVVLNSGTINVGTFVNNGGTVAVVQNAGTVQGGSIVVTAGTMVQTTGTINTGTFVANGGTIGTLLAGTVTASLNPLPLVNPILHGGTAGTLGIGTLITAASMGAGTAGFITGFQVTVISGSAEVILAFGTQVNGPQVIMHGGFPAGGGIARDIQYPHGYGTTNSAITYQILSGSGTVAWDVNYFPHT